MFLQSKSLHIFQTVKEDEPSPGENSRLDEKIGFSILQKGRQDVLSDQNQSEQIQHHQDFAANKMCEESLNKGSKYFSYLQEQRRKSTLNKKNIYDHNLQFLGKILFFTFIFCILVGIFAAIIERSLRNENDIPNEIEENQKSLLGVYNNMNNKFSKNDFRKYQEMDVKSPKNYTKIQGKVTTEKNLKNEEKKEKGTEESSFDKLQISKKDNGLQQISQAVNALSQKSSEIQMKQERRQKQQQTEKQNKMQGSVKIVEGLEVKSEISQQIKEKFEDKKIQNKKQENKKVQTEVLVKNDLVTNSVQNAAKKSAVIPVTAYPEGNIIPQPQCSNFIMQQRTKYGRLYQFSINRKVFRMNSNVQYFLERVPTQITKQKYAEAVDLLQAIHNIDQNGNINVKDTPCESGQSLSVRINQNVQKQTARLNKQYQMDSYFNNQLRFCIVTNSYNNAKSGLIYRNIDSILQQNYTNYHVVYTDDNSSDETGEIVKKYLADKKIPQTKIKVKINYKKVGMMENIYNAITFDCQEGEIAIMLDGDDSFIGTNVLSLLNALYQKYKVALMWNNFLQINQNSRAMMGFSRSLENFADNFKSYRITHRFVSSHLKSFFVDLFRKVKKQDLQENNGKFYGGASDTAMMMPMLQLAFPRIQYVPEIVYEYRFDTGQVGMTVNMMPQAVALTKIGLTQPYTSLTDFSFVDKAIQKAQNKLIQDEKQSQIN